MQKMVQFDIDDWVEFVGLQKSPRLNGKIGRIYKAEPNEEGRLQVMMHDKLIFKEYRRSVNMGRVVRSYLTLRNQNNVRLFKPQNLFLVPEAKMKTLVRYACDGEISECRVQFEAIQFPQSHPIFFQNPNTPIPNKIGVPLILTKIEIPEMIRQGMQDGSYERGWCINQACVYMKADVESGFAIKINSSRFADCSNVDYFGPAFVCRPGGYSDWTVKEANDLHAYLTYLMQDCYGEDNFSGPRDITSQHYKSFLGGRSSLRDDESDADIQLRVLFKAAWNGNAEDFATCLHSPDFNGEMINAKRRGYSNRDEISLLEAAICGGKGEIIGAIMTHESFDMQIINDNKSFESMGKRSMAYLPAKAVKDNIDPIKQPRSEVQRANWNIYIVHLCRVTKIKYPDGNVDYHEALKSTAIFLPKPGEYRLDSSIDYERLGVNMHMLDEYPFPHAKLLAWLETSEYKAIFRTFGNIPFNEMHCDIDLLKKTYVLTLDIDSILSTHRRDELRNIGWRLFFRGSKDAMIVHKSVFDVLIMKFCSSYFAFDDMREKCKFLELSWDRIGTWVA